MEILLGMAAAFILGWKLGGNWEREQNLRKELEMWQDASNHDLWSWEVKEEKELEDDTQTH